LRGLVDLSPRSVVIATFPYIADAPCRTKKYLLHFGGTVNAPASAEEKARGHVYSQVY
jgi:hypothetical protein